MTNFREVTPLSGEPVRSSTMFLPDIVKLRDEALVRYENTETKAQIAALDARIADGEAKIVAATGKVSVATLKNAKDKLRGLKDDRARLIYNNELPFVALDAVADLLQRTTVIGAATPETSLNAYIRVVIPGITTFEADLVLPDIPF